MFSAICIVDNLIKQPRSITDGELVYRDPSGGLSILSTESFTTRVLMTNSTFVSSLLYERWFDLCPNQTILIAY